MRPVKGIRVLVLLIIPWILISAVGTVGTVQGAVDAFIWFEHAPVSGGGSLGPGSLAVAAIFSATSSSGIGSFSGTIGGVRQSGLFSLTISNPANTPPQPCVAGQLSAGGTVTDSFTGSLLGDNVIIAGCTGSGVPASFYVYQKITFTWIFAGTGTGSLIPRIGQEVAVEAAAAGVISGSGSAGPGTIYTAEADGIARDGSLLGGGALTGTVSDINSGSVWQINKASLQSGCTLNTSGVTAPFGSFHDQPVSSSYTLLTCPPSSLGPQTARFVYAIGGDVNPIYSGTGSARLFIQKPGHIQ